MFGTYKLLKQILAVLQDILAELRGPPQIKSGIVKKDGDQNG